MSYAAIPFWNRVNKSGGDDSCWPWIGCLSSGYGSYWLTNKMVLAHRVAYFLTYGSIDVTAPTDRKNSNQFVLHSCDNKICCNPKHLHLGSYLDNAKECKERGRMIRAKGSSHGLSKLRDEQIAEMRQLHTTGLHSYRDLAKKYGVTYGNVGKIIRRELYV